MNKTFHKIAILGGHKLAASYFAKLCSAQSQNQLRAAKIVCVTDDPKAAIWQHTTADHVLALSNAEFLLQEAFHQTPHLQDILVPDHTAKHVMLQAYMALAKAILPQAKVELSPLDWPLATPFVHKAENDALIAMSYATWMCPADCHEPQICPHTQKNRDWDFNTALPPVYQALKKQNVVSYDFACQPLHAEISFIPMIYIHKQFLDFQKRLNALVSTQTFAVATHSHCHGIVGGLQVTP